MNKRGQSYGEDAIDYVRIEIETAIRTDRHLVPIIVENAFVPKEHELPESIRKMARLNGYAVRPDPDFNHDMDCLCGKLGDLLGLPANEVRKPGEMDGELQEQRIRLSRLQDQWEFRQSLENIDREWRVVQERRKIWYPKNGEALEPTLRQTIRYTSKPFLWSLAPFGGALIPGAPCPVVLFLLTVTLCLWSSTISRVLRDRAYRKECAKYVERREAAVRCFKERYPEGASEHDRKSPEGPQSGYPLMCKPTGEAP